MIDKLPAYLFKLILTFQCIWIQKQIKFNCVIKSQIRGDLKFILPFNSLLVNTNSHQHRDYLIKNISTCSGFIYIVKMIVLLHHEREQTRAKDYKWSDSKAPMNQRFSKSFTNHQIVLLFRRRVGIRFIFHLFISFYFYSLAVYDVGNDAIFRFQ